MGLTRRDFLRSMGALALAPLAACEYYNHINYEDSLIYKEEERLQPLAGILTKSTSTEKEAVENFIQWIEKNFFHAYDQWGWNIYSNESNLAKLVLNVSINELFSQRIVGCQLTAFLLIALSRSIGIDAKFVDEEGVCDTGDRHAVVYFPKLDSSMVIT